MSSGNVSLWLGVNGLGAIFFRHIPYMNFSAGARALALPVRTMPLGVRENLVEDVIRIVKVAEGFRDDAAGHGDAEKTRERFNDIVVHLSELMAAMIASPLTGRIFLQSPDAYVDAETRKESVAANFLKRV